MKIEALPDEFKFSDKLMLWKEVPNKQDKLLKVPVTRHGRKTGYNDPNIRLTYAECVDRLSRDEDIGIGITLLDGLKIHGGEDEVFVHCYDFDGFADPCSLQVDPGVLTFFRKYPSYTEISPSGTGFKYFFLSDRVPSTKVKIKFGPSIFEKKYPHVRKYKNREVEVFSKNAFLALTGDCFNSKVQSLQYYSDDQAEEALTYLNNWAISTGGSGSRSTRKTVPYPTLPVKAQKYARLQISSLEVVLAHIDHFDEQVWLDVALGLFRAYGEEGFNYFLSFSQGVYCGINFAAFDEAECRDKFDHAIKLTAKRPGYGLKYLIELAQSHPDWPDTKLEFEDDNPFQEVVETKKKFRFHTATELAARPPLEWRVKGLLPTEGLACIYGPSGSGKSFLALDLLASIALNQDFYGARTKPCPIVYVALEGAGGVSNRIRAYETFHGITLPSSFRIVTERLSLFSLEAEAFAEAVVQENLHGGVIVVDTMAQSAPGSDENSSADMGTIISNSQLLQRITGGLVILIHHTGKDARRGARGHSSLEGALDTGIEVKRSLSGREWRKAKVKDGEADSSYTFHLKMVDLGIDSDGDPITSCVAVGDLFRASQRLEPKGKNQKLVLEALQGVFVEGESISENELMRLAKEAVGTSRNQLQRAKEAVTSLRKIDRIVPAEGGYQLV